MRETFEEWSKRVEIAFPDADYAEVIVDGKVAHCVASRDGVNVSEWTSPSMLKLADGIIIED